MLTACTSRGFWDDVKAERQRWKNNRLVSRYTHGNEIGEGVVIHKLENFTIQSDRPVMKVSMIEI